MELTGDNFRVLELNCGTGEDALWLARRGCQVLATDLSPEMVAITRAKAQAAGVSLDTRICGFADLERLPEGDFDLVFSNFGGLNCLSPADLRALWQVLAKKLRPGGHLVAVVMGRYCWWETLYFLCKGRWRTAFRRWRRGPVPARLDPETTVDTWYYSPWEMQRMLREVVFSVDQGEWIEKSAALQAVGFWLPPSYLNPFFARYPRWLRGLYWLEKKCRGALWAWGADHFLLSARVECR